MIFLRLLFLSFTLILAACAPDAQFQCAHPPAGDVIYVIGEGWHVDIGIPVDEWGAHRAYFGQMFPGARVIISGYGKKTFLTAPPETFSEYILGPVPGPALIQAFGIRVTPPEAYPIDHVTTLSVTPEQLRALTDYIWGDLKKDDAGKPLITGHSTNPAGVFYASASGYSLLHTCNSWAADALHASGLPIDDDGVVFSGQLMSRANEEAQRQCSAAR